jgi:hypothetical protein
MDTGASGMLCQEARFMRLVAMPKLSIATTSTHPFVIPAKAGIHLAVEIVSAVWIPAFAGMTDLTDSKHSPKLKIFVSYPNHLPSTVARGISLGYSRSLILINARKREVERVDKVTCLYFAFSHKV